MLPAEGRKTLAYEGSERFAKHADRQFSKNAQGVLDNAQSVENVAAGKTSLTTIGAEMKRVAGTAAQTVGGVVQNPDKILDAAVTTKNRLVKAIKDFEQASPERKLDALGDLTGDALAEGLKAGATAGAGHLMGGAVGGVRTVANAEEALADAAKAGKKATHAVREAGHADRTGAGAIRMAAKEAAPATPTVDELAKAAGAVDRNGLTEAGRALQKHGSRPGSTFPKARGTSAQINQTGQQIVDDILTTPGSKVTKRHHARFGDIIELRTPDGKGIRYDAKGNFLGFLEP